MDVESLAVLSIKADTAIVQEQDFGFFFVFVFDLFPPGQDLPNRILVGKDGLPVTADSVVLETEGILVEPCRKLILCARIDQLLAHRREIQHGKEFAGAIENRENRRPMPAIGLHHLFSLGTGTIDPGRHVSLQGFFQMRHGSWEDVTVELLRYGTLLARQKQENRLLLFSGLGEFRRKIIVIQVWTILPECEPGEEKNKTQKRAGRCF